VSKRRSSIWPPRVGVGCDHGTTGRARRDEARAPAGLPGSGPGSLGARHAGAAAERGSRRVPLDAAADTLSGSQRPRQHPTQSRRDREGGPCMSAEPMRARVRGPLALLLVALAANPASAGVLHGTVSGRTAEIRRARARDTVVWLEQVPEKTERQLTHKPFRWFRHRRVAPPLPQ